MREDSSNANANANANSSVEVELRDHCDDWLSRLPQATMPAASAERIRARAQGRLARLRPPVPVPALPPAALHPMLRAALFVVSAVYVAGFVLTLARQLPR